LISNPGCFPRKRKGVVLLKSKDAKNLNAIYVHKHYTNPCVDGQFHVSETVYDAYPLFADMATCKINTTLILNELNAPGTINFPVGVQGRAVKNTLLYFRKSYDHFSSLFPDNVDANFKQT